MIGHALELKPLVVAALIGAFVLWTWGYIFEKNEPSGSHLRDFAAGGSIGAIVQVGVRLAGVS